MRRQSKPCALSLVVSMVMLISSGASTALGEPNPWQIQQARVLPGGGLEWSPAPFEFRRGQEVRYIDFDAGDDNRDGRTPQSAWKHHPWDTAATGLAGQDRIADTFVFKRGVAYRGSIQVRRGGTPDKPLRLTSDPNWGGGEQPALIVGSQRVTGWKRLSDHPDIPDPKRVWVADLDFAPRNVWVVNPDGSIRRIPLARTPNWTITDPDDVKSNWWQFDNPGPKHFLRTRVGDTEMHLGIDTRNLHLPREDVEGAYVWSEYGWVMGTPYPSRIAQYDPQVGSIAFEGQWGRGAGDRHVPRFSRYYLEDKPHFLDDPDGEFWFEKQGNGGRLYLLPPDGRDPNQLVVEAARHLNLIDAVEMRHIEISGLTFRFTNTFWDLDAAPARHRDVDPASIRLLGSGQDITIANCVFEHVNTAVRFVATGDNNAIDGVIVRDNDLRFTDHAGIVLSDGSSWGQALPTTRLFDVKVLRNRLLEIGRRPTRYGQGHAIDITCAQTCEVAGNIGNRLWGAGIFVYGGKQTSARTDRPLSRILIHHNQIVDSMLNTNDWGGIETWQGGPAYVFNNVSGNPGGLKLWGIGNQPDVPGSARFGHAYYMDGGFKQYYFNNIAWGQSSDPFSVKGNTAAFQEIHGFLAHIFNNTAYNFVIGSRRQAPVAGQNKYLGNIWHTMGHQVFRHADGSGPQADPNAADAAARKSNFQHNTNAYHGNVFYKLPKQVGLFEPDGRWYGSVEDFRTALHRRGTIGDVGQAVEQSPLKDPAKLDFRPTEANPRTGVRVFVPWALSRVVGEWHFYPVGDDPTVIPDEHFHLAPYYVNREDYHQQPAFPLNVPNATAEAYVEGPLEDWTRGSLQLDGARFATVSVESLDPKPAQREETLPVRTYNWITLDTPQGIDPERPNTIKVTLKDAKPGSKINVELIGMLINDNPAGTLATGTPRDAAAAGAFEFDLTLANRPRLAYFEAVVFLSPTGKYADKTAEARFWIPKRISPPEGGYRTPRVGKTNFLVEAYVRFDRPANDAVLVQNATDTAGYALTINPQGRLVFHVRGEGQSASLLSQSPVADGNWRHVLVEADRTARKLRVYVDGKLDAEADGLGDVSLDNAAPLLVGGTPQGRGVVGQIEFLRIAHGTLADALTTIEQLYAWQFDGPFLRDFAGRKPDGKRHAGALEPSESPR